MLAKDGIDAEVVNICTIKLLHKYMLDGEGVYKQVKAFVEE